MKSTHLRSCCAVHSAASAARQHCSIVSYNRSPAVGAPGYPAGRKTLPTAPLASARFSSPPATGFRSRRGTPSPSAIVQGDPLLLLHSLASYTTVSANTRIAENPTAICGTSRRNEPPFSQETEHWLRNHLNAVVVRRVVEVLHRELPALDRLLDSGQDSVHLLHQVSDALAHLLEAVLAPPLGLIRIQASASALVENVAGGAGLADQLRVVQLLRMEAYA